MNHRHRRGSIVNLSNDSCTNAGKAGQRAGEAEATCESCSATAVADEAEATSSEADATPWAGCAEA